MPKKACYIKLVYILQEGVISRATIRQFGRGRYEISRTTTLLSSHPAVTPLRRRLNARHSRAFPRLSFLLADPTSHRFNREPVTRSHERACDVRIHEYLHVCLNAHLYTRRADACIPAASSISRMRRDLICRPPRRESLI